MRLTAIVLLASIAAIADEGMWTFDNLPLQQMKEKHGFAPDAAWLKRMQLATVRFPGGTGAFISSEGLVITNHHIGRGWIQQVSSAKQDYIKDGFAAASRKGEIPVPGLELMLLVSTEDVTARVNAAVRPGMDEKEALKARRGALSELRRAEEAATGLVCEPVTLYQGGEYWLYRYRKFKDIRFVAAPELEVADFGGDHDNYTYPRWSLDFSLFRVYENGKPFRPEAFLPFTRTPLKAGDMTLLSGHPGTTFRGQTYAQMGFAREVGIPDQLALLARQRRVIELYAKTSAEAARVAWAAINGIANQEKRLNGQLLGLMKPQNLERVAAQEAALRAAVAWDPALRSEAGASWDRIAQAMGRQRLLLKEHNCISALSSALLGHALTLVRILEEEAKPSGQRLPEFAEGSLKTTRERLLNPRPIVPGLDGARLAWLLQEAQEQLGQGHPFVQAMLGGGSAETVAQAAVAGTRLHEPAFRKQLLAGGREALAVHADPLLALARKLDPFQRAIQKQWDEQVQSVVAEHGGRIAQARFRIHGKSHYPDATFSLRLNWGNVATYATGSGTKAQPFTTFLGLYDRHLGWGGNEARAEAGSWTLPARWLARKMSLDLTVPFNFVYNCDTVGGNSGSPVVNAAGEFVGINFDSVFEGQGGYYVYDDESKRAVAVDARAILQSLEKVMGAAAISREIRGAAGVRKP